MLQYLVTTLNEIHSKKGGRSDSVRDEQSLCRSAMESGKYDLLSDEEWVTLCETVSVTARKNAGDDPETNPTQNNAL